MLSSNKPNPIQQQFYIAFSLCNYFVMISILHIPLPFPCRNWWCKKCNKKLKGPAFRVRKTLGMSNLIKLYSLQNIWLLLVIGLYLDKNFTKDMCSIPMDMAVELGLHKFSLQSTYVHISIIWPIGGPNNSCYCEILVFNHYLINLYCWYNIFCTTKNWDETGYVIFFSCTRWSN